jgi:valyl-tRNA synthetase
MFEPVDEKDAKLSELDKLMLSEMSRLVSYAKKNYENFDFSRPAAEVRHFMWEVFASNYMELVKNRAYNQSGQFSKSEQNGAIYTLHTILDTGT